MENKGFKKKYLVIIWTVTLIVMVCALIYHVFGFTGKIISLGSNSKTGEAYYDFNGNEVSVINIDITAADIDIEYGDNFDVTYNGKEKYTPLIDYKDGKLDISYDKDISMFGNDLDDYKLTVRIPEGTKLDELYIDVDAGDIDVNQINGSKLTVDTDAGDYNVSDVVFDEIELVADAGDIEIENSQCDSMEISASLGSVDVIETNFRDGTLNVEVGDISVEGEFESLKADCELGNINIVTSNPEDADIDVNCELGNVRVNGKKYN